VKTCRTVVVMVDGTSLETKSTETALHHVASVCQHEYIENFHCVDDLGSIKVSETLALGTAFIV
jgi:hypothetical protein